MGNIITLVRDSIDPDKWLSMSNGLTDVFLDVIVLSASALADNDRERELTVWFAENDQSVRGRGTVGFSLSDIPWNAHNFPAEKRFLLRAITQAEEETDWHRLNYSPNEVSLTWALAKFRRMIEGFTAEQISAQTYQEWRDTQLEFGVPLGFPRCPIHDVLLYWSGCIVCNNKVE